MLLYPGKYVREVEDSSFRCAYGMLEGLEGHGAEVEGQSFESGAGVTSLAGICTCAGREGVFRRPFAVCDVQFIRA